MPAIALIVPLIACLWDQGAFDSKVPPPTYSWTQFQQPQDTLTLVVFQGGR